MEKCTFNIDNEFIFIKDEKEFKELKNSLHTICRSIFHGKGLYHLYELYDDFHMDVITYLNKIDHLEMKNMIDFFKKIENLQ